MAGCHSRLISQSSWKALHQGDVHDTRAWLCDALGLQGASSEQHHIELDLYAAALRHGMALGLSDQQTSSLVGIVKQVHDEAVAQKLPMEVAFKRCGDLFLMHSIERPPQSSAIFSLKDMQSLLEWLQNTYFLHFPMYQYVFTPAVLLDFQAVSPGSLYEHPPALPPLDAAMTEEDWTQQKAAEAARQQEERAALQKQEAEAAEAARQEALRSAYVVAIPDEIKAQVEAAVAKEVAAMKESVEAEYRSEATQLREQIAALKA